MSETISDSNNENNEKVEQITKIPTAPIQQLKDPKKVAAGKKLADYNRRAKRKQQEVKERSVVVPEENNDLPDSWLPKTSLTTLIALVGLGFTAFDLFLRYKSQTAVGEKTEPEIGVVETFAPPTIKPDPTQRYGME